MRHLCHWPGCQQEVPPARWGCTPHWYQLPKALRDQIWATYRPGQEVTKTPSRAYIEAAQAVQAWIKEYGGPPPGARWAPALSIRQPWAWLIVNGFKDIENREWRTPFRGRFLVHASKTMARVYYNEVRDSLRDVMDVEQIPAYEDLPRGGIVGEAVIVDCVDHSDSPWFMGPHGFVLRKAAPLPFREWKGRLQFFDVPEVAS